MENIADFQALKIHAPMSLDRFGLFLNTNNQTKHGCLGCKFKNWIFVLINVLLN